ARADPNQPTDFHADRGADFHSYTRALVNADRNRDRHRTGSDRNRGTANFYSNFHSNGRGRN
ncbi:MAG: hypothetical protein ACOC9Y_10335, partial [Chloroflexota bacterium]